MTTTMRGPIGTATTASVGGSARRARRGALGRLVRGEISKIVHLRRIQLAAVACALLPLAFAGVVGGQSSAPEDTLFGQWVHESGFAVPLVLLSFSGQWVLPLLAALVCGDVFSSEDHFGTWKLLLTRSRSRGEIFVAKVLAALVLTCGLVVLLAAGSIVAGLLTGNQPIVGLAGQLVPSGIALRLVLASWLLQLAPALAFGALAVFCSIVSRSSVIGIGIPVLVGVLLQVVALVSLPVGVRTALPDTAFGSWHALWVPASAAGPVTRGLLASLVWIVVLSVSAWWVLRRRAVRLA